MDPPEEQLVIEVRFKIQKDAEGFPKSRDYELLLCRPQDPECTQCVIASVPFYLNDVAYGDTITTREGSRGELEFGEVAQRGGYSTYRIYLHDQSKRDEFITKLLDLGAVVEQNVNLIAAAIPLSTDSDAVVDYILEGKEKGFWGAQDGFIFERN
jgi:hypothetical protein